MMLMMDRDYSLVEAEIYTPDVCDNHIYDGGNLDNAQSAGTNLPNREYVSEEGTDRLSAGKLNSDPRPTKMGAE